jgi:hypothetical protein
MEDSAARALNRIHKLPGGTRYAGGALQQIQQRAFGPQNAPELSTQQADSRSGANRIAVPHIPLDGAATVAGHGGGVLPSRQSAPTPKFDDTKTLERG